MIKFDIWSRVMSEIGGVLDPAVRSFKIYTLGMSDCAIIADAFWLILHK